MYAGGGFPETHAESLFNNRTVQGAVSENRGWIAVYAECGGLIYLSDSIMIDGNNYPMTRIFR